MMHELHNATEDLPVAAPDCHTGNRRRSAQPSGSRRQQSRALPAILLLCLAVVPIGHIAALGRNEPASTFEVALYLPPRSADSAIAQWMTSGIRNALRERPDVATNYTVIYGRNEPRDWQTELFNVWPAVRVTT